WRANTGRGWDHGHDMNLTNAVRSSGTALVFVSDDSTICVASDAAEALWGRGLEGVMLAELLGDAARGDLRAALEKGSSFEAIIEGVGDPKRVAVCPSRPTPPRAR